MSQTRALFPNFSHIGHLDAHITLNPDEKESHFATEELMATYTPI
jgi:hypothetical protein